MLTGVCMMSQCVLIPVDGFVGIHSIVSARLFNSSFSFGFIHLDSRAAAFVSIHTLMVLFETMAWYCLSTKQPVALSSSTGLSCHALTCLQHETDAMGILEHVIELNPRSPMPHFTNGLIHLVWYGMVWWT